MTESLRRGLSTVAWVAAVIVIALGAAGLVAATDPGTGGANTGRLSYDGDALVTTALDAIEADVMALGEDVDALGTQARGALSSMISGDLDRMEAAIADGDALLEGITTRSEAVTAALAAVDYVGTPEAPLHVSAEVRDRHARLARAVTATTDLESAWTRLTSGAAAAGRLSGQLEEHDRLVAKAAEQGRDAKYKAAIKTLKEASDALADGQAYRDRLVATVDVSTLDEWLDRNRTYDKALSDLYDALSSVGGRVTNKVRKAIAAEEAARGRLPPDSRGMIVIMSDIAQGGLNSAVVAIEEAKAGLSDITAPGSPTP